MSDILTLATTGVSGTNYAIWSGKHASSDAVYAGNSAGGNNAIQLRSKSNSGIVTTASGGKIQKVSVRWNTNTTDDRVLDVYGSNTAYSEPKEMYGSDKKGTKLGSIRKGTETELTVSGDYLFVGVRSASGAMYLDELTFTWAGGASAVTYYTSEIECAGTGIKEVGSETPNAVRSEKIVKDGQLYIRHNNNMYTATGTKVQ